MRKITGINIRLTFIRRLMRQTKLRNTLLTTNVESLTEVCKNFGAVHKLVNELHGVHTISLDYVHARDNKKTTKVIETS